MNAFPVQEHPINGMPLSNSRPGKTQGSLWRLRGVGGSGNDQREVMGL